MRKLVAALCAGCAVLVSASGAYAQAFDMELRSLVDDHPLIKSNEAQVSAAQQGLRSTLSPFLPNLDVAGGAGYERVNSPSFRATPEGPFDTDSENYSATLR